MRSKLSDQVTGGKSELANAPTSPTARNRISIAPTVAKRAGLPDDGVALADHQSCPSWDINTMASSPTATKSPLPKVTPRSRTEEPLMRGDHSRPSGELRITPFSPTATNCPAPKATAFRVSWVGDGALDQASCARAVPAKTTMARARSSQSFTMS